MFSFSVMADAWPHWRGPALNGTSDSTGLPITWAEGKNVRWKVRLPSWSGSTPVVWQDHIYLASPGAVVAGLTAPTVQRSGTKLEEEGRDLLLLCLSRQDGRVLWQSKLDTENAHYGKQNLSSPSPVTDGKSVWVATGTGVLTCLSMDGQVRWRRNLQKDYGAFGQLWGYASSPLLLPDKLILEVLHGLNTDEPSYLLAVELATGKTLWKVDRPTDAELESPDAYTTPVPMRSGDRTLIVVSGGDYITAHDAADGHEAWRCGGLNPKHNNRYRCVSSPLVVGDLAVASVREGPLVACRDGGKGLVTATHTAWTHPIAPDVPTPVSDGKLVYILQDRGFLTCLDLATGKPVYEKQRLARGTYSASPLLADGRLYLTSEEARTTVVAAGREFRILAENQLDDSYTLSSIAVAGRELFVRTSHWLYCICDTTSSSSPAR